MSARTYVDVHILQTVPPSNLNRDDAGSPKQAVYGGTRRARVSSQAWKRATRMLFAEHQPKEELATRTKKMQALLTDRLVQRTGLAPEPAAQVSAGLLKQLGIGKGKKADETAYLLFFGYPQLDALADAVAPLVPQLGATPDEGTLDKILAQVPVAALMKQGHPLDVALFGRMVADLATLNVDAAVQVAHAISTHAVELEFDYYTAVDDENPEEETGAGMIGTVEFNSATLYRYASLAVHQLEENLGDPEATVTGVEMFLDAYARSIPSGHQNSFAHRTLPSLVAVVVRDDQPINLVSAFEEPVRSRSGVLAESAKRLAEEFAGTNDRWGGAPLAVAASYAPALDRDAVLTGAFGASVGFPELLATVRAAVETRVATRRPA